MADRATDHAPEPTIDAEDVEPGEHPVAVVEAGTPASFIADAIKQGLPIETMERLFALYERREADGARKAFYGALSAFQAAVPPLAKDAVVDFTSPKGRTYYKHASLPAIAEAIRKPLETHGLCYRFTADTEDGKVRVTCIVTHVAGHSEETSMTAPADTSGSKNAIQALGSGMTYLRRYTLVAALGLTTADEDTDGRQNGGGAPRQPEATTRRPAAPVHPFTAGDRPSFTFKTIEPKDKWRERPQNRKAKWFSVELADGTIVWCFTESNPESAEAKNQWAMEDEGTFLVDDTDFKDGTPCAKVSEVRRKPKAKAGSALLESVLAYKEALLMRDWLSGCEKVLGAADDGKVIEPDEDAPAAKLVALQGLFEPLLAAAEGGGEDVRQGAEGERVTAPADGDGSGGHPDAEAASRHGLPADIPDDGIPF